MKRKILSFLLVLALLSNILPAQAAPLKAQAAVTPWDGTATTEPSTDAEGVYQIDTGAELAWFAKQVNERSAQNFTDDVDTSNGNGLIRLNAVLTDDIDLGSREWTPIGDTAYITYAYGGTFDGQGHTISNLKIDATTANCGLFALVNGATIQNLNVEGTVTSSKGVGGIVGKIQTATIQNCSMSGSVTSTGKSTQGYAGGIVGAFNAAGAVIKGCHNAADISGAYGGGIVGYNTKSADISYCYNTGDITGTTRGGGIAGQSSSGSISYCYTASKTTTNVYGFSNATITGCYYLPIDTTDSNPTPGGSPKGDMPVEAADATELLEKLNAGEEALFTADKENKNGGNPILVWEGNAAPDIKQEDKDAVMAALETLSLPETIKEKTTLNLPAASGSCSITWTSDTPSVVSDTGEVTLPDKNIVNVTLTASVTCNTYTNTKSFTVCIWPENIAPQQYLDMVLDAIQWDYKNLAPLYGTDTNILASFENLLKEKGYDGVAVTVESTDDESLISKNGKIFYPAIDENSYAEGKQVKILFRLTVGDATAVWPEGDSNALLVPWDTGSVKTALETAADAVLTEDALCADNEDFQSVKSDLTLPSHNGKGEGKYSFAQITWQSSDEAHLAISEEQRTGSADAMIYAPYVGKVKADDTAHTVMLTATLTNPSTNATAVKTFEVTVLPMDEGQREQTLGTMQSILACYTADKLTDFATKTKLDTAAVDNDIQLVIPAKVVTAEELAALNYGKYWDYWNYKFTVTSSDTDVVEINSFRAYVYRPLGETGEADKKVTLTVKMESRANPNLFVTKDIPVTVKHLNRAEFNEALAFMETAKRQYAEGLLGNNKDTYSIIDNLTPYIEIVPAADASGVEFIYRNADKKNTGVRVDELPGWESQEDWRLFHTSNKDLLANETLILNETPTENTFVKINSVLTHEALGKYYTKFQNEAGYDAEALAKFKQLYKQPVSAYVMVVGTGNYTGSFLAMPEQTKAQAYSSSLNAYKKEVESPVTVTFTLLGLDGTPIIEKTTETGFTKDATVFDLFKKVLGDNNVPYTAKGSYVVSIAGLSETQHGKSSGWMYSVDGVFVNSYMNAQTLSDGDDIIVKYVTDYSLAGKGESPVKPTPQPTTSPVEPTAAPTIHPTKPTAAPTKKPTAEPTKTPKPSAKPTKKPAAPTAKPTQRPTQAPDKTPTTVKKKKIKILKLTSCKTNSKRIVGKTLKTAKVTVKIGKYKYVVKANKKGKFVIRLKKKLKIKNKIRVTVSKKGYITRRKTFKVKRRK